jgi:hypothetical protein
MCCLPPLARCRHPESKLSRLNGWPVLIWSATGRTLQLSPCSCEEAIASDDEDNEVIDCYHLKRLRVLALDRTSASGGEIWTSDRDFADTLFQIDERSKFQTQKGLIFGLV